MTDSDARQQNLQELAASPNVSLMTLERTVWETVGDVLYETGDHHRLLSAVRPVVERLATHEKLAPDSDMRMNAGILLGTWGVLSAFARGESPTQQVRTSSQRQLGSLVSATTGQTFDMDGLAPESAKKLSEIITLQLLQRNNDSHFQTYGLLAPPYLHHFRGVEPVTGTTAFQVYAGTRHRFVPTYTSRLPEESMYEKGRYQGVLVVALGQLLLSSARKFPLIIEQSKQHPTIREGQRWLTNNAARLLNLETGPQSDRSLLSEGDRQWLDATTVLLSKLVYGFKPSKNQSPF